MLSDDELKKRLEQTAQIVKIGGNYRHYKGKDYQVINIALDEESLEPCVIYKALYGHQNTFVRKLSVWTSKVDGNSRFTYLPS